MGEEKNTSKSDVIIITEDCSSAELIRALAAKGEGRKVKVVRCLSLTGEEKKE